MSSWDQKSSLFCKKVKNRRNFCVFEDFLKGFCEISLFGKTLFTGNQCHQNTNQTCFLALLTAACSAHIFLSSFLEKMFVKQYCFTRNHLFSAKVHFSDQQCLVQSRSGRSIFLYFREICAFWSKPNSSALHQPFQFCQVSSRM